MTLYKSDIIYILQWCSPYYSAAIDSCHIATNIQEDDQVGYWCEEGVGDSEEGVR